MRNINYLLLSISVAILLVFSTQSYLVSYRFMFICIALIPLLIPFSSYPPVIEFITNNKNEIESNPYNFNQDRTAYIITRILFVTLITTIAFPCVRFLFYFCGVNIGIFGSSVSDHSFCRFVEILMASSCILQTLTNLYMFWRSHLKSFGIAAISNICIIISYCIAYETYNSFVIID